MVSDAFRNWVRNTIISLGGIDPHIWHGSERKWALTFAETRTGSCQVPADIFVQPSKSASMRVCRLATTNQAEEPRILH